MIFFHSGHIVTDIEQSCAELTAALGVRWSPIQDRELGEWRSRIAFSVDGPPYLEIIQGSPGSPWDAEAFGDQLHHIGYWSDDVAADGARLIAAGMPVILDGAAWGRSTTIHMAPHSGTRLELLDVVHHPAMCEAYGVDFIIPGA